MSGEMNSFIDDGYTEEGFIAAVPGFHGSLAFTYRPLLAETRDKLQRAQMTDVEKGHKIAREELSRAIKSWDLSDRNGTKVQIAPANIARLRPMLQDKLYGIVTGQMASDLKPDVTPAADEEKPHSVEESLKN